MEIPLVSVCVITYQHVNFIKKCLDGVLMQKTVFPFEIIVGEDESKDGTREICKEYAEKYPDKIRLFLRSRKDVIYVNGNPTGRYNFMECIKSAKGKYAAICEGDDYWCDENKLQKQVDFLEANPEYSICFHKVNELMNGQLMNSKTNISTEEETYTISQLAKGNFIHTPSVVFRNKLFTEFPKWFSTSPVGDYVFHMLNARHGLIKYFPQSMAVYRSHDGGIWSNSKKIDRLEKWLIVIDCLLQEHFEPEVKQILSEQKVTYRERYLKALMKEPDWGLFLENLSAYSKEDENIAQKWLIEYYPQYIASLRASRSYRFSEFVRLFYNKFRK